MRLDILFLFDITNQSSLDADVKDAEWIADLLRHRLLRGSFIPSLIQRDLRDLTRQLGYQLELTPIN